ncbi:hypothetical protein [Parafrankia sp. BMG5.11]|uniref:hypothetical protein n=1 Tax=Parafrankia sp. BMG5.11 TaxID=222540 RepID=UPI00103BEBAA|nr:hypothetical protein [Parafrankia sp. BMG5.11]TCJ39343.1 hypothetical protein E0504_09455 [Parafrankia sp. BMG5.11]
MTDPASSGEELPRIAILAGAIGFLLTSGLIGFIGWQALSGAGGATTPALSVQAGRIHPTAGGYLVEFEARNRSPRTAAAVEVEATLEIAGSQPVTSVVSLDYVPGDSSQRGGVVLPADPRTGRLTLRVTGYAEP